MRPVVLCLFLAPLLTCCKAEEKPVDCRDIHHQDPTSKSGVYTIYPSYGRYGIQAYCDMETEGGRWTVIQRRMDGTLNFYRPWDQYVAGFGDADGEYWLGLDYIHKLTSKQQELLVEMEDFEENKASAHYSYFSVGAECDGYKLNVSGFTYGGAGDSLTIHSGMKFSTFDNDQDTGPSNCAQHFYGAFWYNNCHSTNPNGVYRWGADTIYAVGTTWNTWKGQYYSLKSITMKTRPAE